MIGFYSLSLILVIVQANINDEYLLEEYAPRHGNYKPTNVLQMQEKWRNNAFQLVEPNIFTPTFQQTLEPNNGFQTIIKRLHIPPEEYTSGQKLYYQNTDRLQFVNKTRYGVPTTNNAIINNDENKNKDYLKMYEENNASRRLHKKIVKKNAEREFAYPGNNENYQHSSNLEQSAVQIDSLNIPESEKQMLYQLALNPSQSSPTFGRTQINQPEVNYNQFQAVPLLQSQNVKNENQEFRIVVDEAPNQFKEANNQNYQGMPYSGQSQIPLESEKLQDYQTSSGNIDINASKLQHVLSLINTQPYINSKLQNIHRHLSNENAQLPVVQNKKIYLSSQNQYPLILVDANGKFGLPFYPSTHKASLPTNNNDKFNYEGIPLLSTKSDSDQSGSSPVAQQRNDGLFTVFQLPNFGNSPVTNIFQPANYPLQQSGGGYFEYQSYPPGSSRETIWQAGDATANREPEILVRQLNETCAYFRFNETTPSTEDGSRPNIWQAGDYSAQQQGEELIRSVNITCDNFTDDAMNNFTSGYNLFEYCSYCLQRGNGDDSEDSQQYVTNINSEQNPTDYTQVSYQQDQTLPLDYYNNRNGDEKRANGEIAGIYYTNPIEQYFSAGNIFDRNQYG